MLTKHHEAHVHAASLASSKDNDNKVDFAAGHGKHHAPNEYT